MSGLPPFERDLVRGSMHVGGVPYVLRGHTWTLGMERAVADVLGLAPTEILKVAVARPLVRDLVLAECVAKGVGPGGARFTTARALFSTFGEGRLTVENEGERKIGVGESLLTSTASEIEQILSGDGRVDGFVGGWLAAGLELAIGRPAGTLSTRERRGTGSRRVFDFGRDDTAKAAPIRWLAPAADVASVPEQLPAPQAAALLDTALVDPRGLRQSFGQLVSTRPVAWHAALIARAALDLRDEAELLETFRLLLVEATARETLQWFVAAALSDEWEVYGGGRPSSPLALATVACAMAAACGWGAVAPLAAGPEGVSLIAGPLVDVGSVEGTEAPRVPHLLEGLARGLSRAMATGLIGDDPPDRKDLHAAWARPGTEVVERRVEGGEDIGLTEIRVTTTA